jgi:hypothetical protein
LVRDNSEIWLYPHKHIKDLFQKINKIDPRRFNRERGSFSNSLGIMINLKSELPKPFKKYS